MNEHYPQSVFTTPDLDEHVPDLKRRSVKRVLDHFADQGLVEIVEQGYKRKPTKYRLLKGGDNGQEGDTEDGHEN